MKTEEGWKRKKDKETRIRTDGNAVARRHCGAAHAAGLLMSAQIEAGIIISV